MTIKKRGVNRYLLWMKYQENKMHSRVFHEKKVFDEKIGSTRSASIWRLLWRNSKAFLILKALGGAQVIFVLTFFTL